MTRRGRLGLLLVGGAGLAALLLAALLQLPLAGASSHPYGDQAVAVAVGLRQTANTVASVTFDERGFDTMGEEFILFAAVLGAALLLRLTPEEREQAVRRDAPDVLDAVRLSGVVLLPVTVAVGLAVVASGHLTPGGGFQGGVVLATAVHLLFLAGDYPALQRVRPVELVSRVEAAGAVGYVVVGVAGLVASGAFLANVIPQRQLGDLVSAGTVPVLNLTVGLEVGAGMVLLLAEFLEQALVIRRGPAPT